MANYSTDEALVKVRPDILSHGVADWETEYGLHSKAKSRIDRRLETRWYKQVAADYDVDPTETPFDADRLDATQLADAACYLVLHFAYLILMKGTPEQDGFERLADKFQGMHEKEMQQLLSYGINYDWDESDTIDSDERLTPQYRNLVRV